MAIIVDTVEIEIPGIKTISFRQDGRLRLRFGEDSRRRPARDIRGIVLHTTKGIPGGSDMRQQVIRPGFGPSVDAGLRCSRLWSTSRKNAGAHLVVDFDGAVYCCCDVLLEAAFHAGPVNTLTIGIEIYQGSSAELYEGQLDTVVRLVDFLTRYFGIQRQVPERYRGVPLSRFSAGDGNNRAGRDFYGVYGHRDVSADRGRGDPGSEIFLRLIKAGYEGWDLDAREDVAAWRPRQKALGLGLVADGIPGPMTVRALANSGRPHGIWVRRPGDELPITDPPLVA